MLTQEQIKEYRGNGYVVLRGAFPKPQMASLIGELDGWITESRSRTKNWGSLPNGKSIFDLEAGHTAQAPRLRRVGNPCDFSAVYKDFVWNGPLADLVIPLIGLNVKFMCCRINLKLPGMAAHVVYHQDSAYNPQTNSDVVTTFLPLDPMSADNGSLKIVPGSHRSRYSHFQEGRFTGAIDSKHFDDFNRAADVIEAEPGDVILMDSWCVHGSDVNRSAIPRRLMITDLLAADAFPLSPLSTLSLHTGEILRGTPTRLARIEPTTIEMPEPFKEDNFFSLQGQGNQKRVAEA